MRGGPRVLGIVLAGGEGKRLAPLTADRAKPAVPFGGNYRLIDFVLSNLVNAEIRQIAVLTQYKSHSLDRHITQTWRMSQLLGNYVTPVPAQQRLGPRWYTGSADAIFQSLNLIYDERPEIVVVFGADHVYRMDPGQMVDQHLQTGAGVTIAGLRVPRKEATEFGVIDADADGKVRGFLGKAGGPAGPAGLARGELRLHGQLRLHHRRAARGPARRRRGRELRPRHGRLDHADARRQGCGVRLRLLDQHRAGHERARPRLLARRRDDRLLLRRAHGPGVGDPGLQPVQRPLADLLPASAAAAGQVRPGRSRRGVDGQRRRDHRRRLGAQLGDLAGGAGRARCPGRGQRPDGRRHHRRGRLRAAGDPGQERRRPAVGADRRRHRRGQGALPRERRRRDRARQGRPRDRRRAP